MKPWSARKCRAISLHNFPFEVLLAARGCATNEIITHGREFAPSVEGTGRIKIDSSFWILFPMCFTWDHPRHRRFIVFFQSARFSSLSETSEDETHVKTRPVNRTILNARQEALAVIGNSMERSRTEILRLVLLNIGSYFAFVICLDASRHAPARTASPRYPQSLSP